MDHDAAISLVALGLGVPADAVRIVRWMGEWSFEVLDRPTPKSRKTSWVSGKQDEDLQVAARETVAYLRMCRESGLFFGPPEE